MAKRRLPDTQLAMAGVVQAPDDEKGYERLIRNRAERWGWMVMKVGKTPVVSKGKRYWITATSLAGWPDLTLIHPLGWLLFLEVKGKAGSPSPEQRDIIRAMQATADRSNGRLGAYIVYPKDWPVVEAMLTRPANQAAPGGNMMPADDQPSRPEEVKP